MVLIREVITIKEGKLQSEVITGETTERFFGFLRDGGIVWLQQICTVPTLPGVEFCHGRGRPLFNGGIRYLCLPEGLALV